MTEVRPRNCRAPELPAPSILDYRPRSTLVTGEHLVPRAKYPVIDFHGHPTAQMQSAPALEQMGAEMDALNIGLMLTANNTSGEQLKRQRALVAASAKMKDRVRILAGIDFRNVGPGWAEKAVAQLDADIAAGAVGVGEIGRDLDCPSRRPMARACGLTTPSSTRCGTRRRGSRFPSSSTPPIPRSSGMT
ncbi:MAG: amidohydrolase family protein [Gemmatimonadaceae bacterium]